MKRLILPLALAVVGGCSSEIDELKAFVRDSEKGLPRRIEPLPPFAEKERVKYTAANLPDPFNPRNAAVSGARK